MSEIPQHKKGCRWDYCPAGDSPCDCFEVVEAGEIERLRSENVRLDAKWRDWESAHQAQKERADFAKARVEELEREVALCETHHRGLPPTLSVTESCRVITDAQIDAMVLMAEEARNDGNMAGWAVLERGGIKRCGGCDGSGSEYAQEEPDFAIGPCDSCSAHGWVKEDSQ